MNIIDGKDIIELHNYLSMVWDRYGCADKDQVTEIIIDELKHADKYKYEQHLKIYIKRRCQNELR